MKRTLYIFAVLFFCQTIVFGQSVPGNSLHFDSYPDRATVPYSPELNGNSFTYEFWALPDLQYGTVFTTGNTNPPPTGVTFYISPSKYWGVQVSNGTYTPNVGLGEKAIPGQWVHMALTRDENTGIMTYYFNGKVSGTYSGIYKADTSNPILIGSNQFYDWSGNIDEVRIWNYPRSSDEINEFMNDTVDVNSTGLLAYYRFESKESSFVEDLAGSHHGIIGSTVDTLQCWEKSYAIIRPMKATFNNINEHEVTVSWSSPDFGVIPKGYYIDMDDDASLSQPIIKNLWVGNDTSFTFTGLHSGSEIHFTVTAYEDDTTGKSQSSAMISGRTIYSNNPGNSLFFDGIDDHVLLEWTLYSAMPEATVETWVNPKSLTDTMTIFEHGDNGWFRIQLMPDSTARVSVFLNDFQWYEVSSSAIIKPNRWQHIAGVWVRNNFLEIYINGILEESIPVPNNNLWDAGIGYTPILGASIFNGLTSHQFHGQLDELRVWDKARTTTQILQNMNDTIFQSTSKLLSYYRFDQTYTGRLQDMSDFGNYYDERIGSLKNFDTTSCWQESYAMLRPIIDSVSQISNSGFRIHWSSPPFGGIPSKYMLTLDDDSLFRNPLLNEINIGNTFSYYITGLDSSTTYYCHIRAFKDNITDESMQSTYVSVTTSNDHPNYIISLNSTICEGDTILFGNQQLYSGGIYVDSLIAINGWDSIITLTLSTNLSYLNSTQNIICEGDSIFFGNSYFSTPGLYFDSLLTINGCDSITSMYLSLNLSFQDSSSIIICSGDSVLFGGKYLSNSGVYYDSLNNISGCDSTQILSLTIAPKYSDTITSVICKGDSILFEGQYLHTNGFYSNNLSSIKGCDSIVTLEINVVNVDTNVITSDSTLISTINADYYQWLDCSDGMSLMFGENNQVYTPTETGSYAVEINWSGCIDTSSCHFQIISGIKNIGLPSSIEVYPIPTKEDLYINITNKSSEAYLELFTINGQLILNKILSTQNLNYIKLPNLSEGMYLLKITIENQSFNKPIFILE